MKKCVSDETRHFMEEQFAECMTFEEVAVLFSDFERIIGDLMRDRHGYLIEDIHEN